MKKLLIGFASLLVVTGAMAQGKVTFSNAFPTPAPVSVNGFTPGNDFTVELVHQGTVLSSTAIIAQGVFNAAEVAIPGADANEQTLTLRVFKTDLGSWEAARNASTAAGSNVAFILEDFTAMTGTAAVPAPPAPTLAGAIAGSAGFQEVVIPEPGVLALGLVGAGAFFMRRRRA